MGRIEMNKLEEMLKRRTYLQCKIKSIQIAIQENFFSVGNDSIRLRFIEGIDEEYALIIDLLALSNVKAQRELKEISVKIDAINELLGE